MTDNSKKQDTPRLDEVEPRESVGRDTIARYQAQFPTSTDGEYVLWLDEENGIHVRCDLRYINHSDEPNAAYYDTLEVCALTDIAPGEEITHDYLGGQW